MATLLFSLFIIILLIIVIIGNYLYIVTANIMKRYNKIKVPFIIAFMFNESLRQGFYVEHKHELSPKELAVFEYYFRMQFVFIPVLLIVMIIGGFIL